MPALTRARIDSSLPSARFDEEVRRIMAARLPIYMLDEARLAALAPDVVVTQAACEVCAISYDQVVASLRRTAPRARVVSLQPSRLADVLRDVRTVAEACGVGARGREGGRLLRDRLDRASRPVRRRSCPAWPSWNGSRRPCWPRTGCPDAIAAAGGVAVGPRARGAVALRDVGGDPRPSPPTRWSWPRAVSTSRAPSSRPRPWRRRSGASPRASCSWTATPT